MYNAEKTILNCIDSIEKQKTNIKFEIIIVDDGSIDSSVEIVTEIMGIYNNVTLLRQKNLKQSAARNNGLANANGKYIMFFDCDDDIEPGMLNKMMNFVDKYDFIMCGINKIFSDKTIIENQSSLSKAQNKKELLENYLTKNKELDVGLWNKVFKLEIIQNNNLHFENGNFFEDSLFILKYLEIVDFNKIRIMDDVFYNLYKRSGSSTTTQYNKKIDYFASLYEDKVFSFLKNSLIDFSSNVNTAFKIRIQLHVINHHIKYDEGWNSYKQKQRLSFVKFNLFWKAIFLLNINYALASILSRYLPNLYMYMYKKKF